RPFWLIERQAYRERAALARFAVDPDIAAHQQAQFLDNRQTQPGSLIGAPGSAIDLPEFLENDVLRVMRYTNSRILNDDVPIVRGAAFERDPHIALIGKLH